VSSWTRTQTTAFVDSAAFYALIDKNSIDYQRAHALLRQLTEGNRKLVTSNFVVAESHALLLNRLGRYMARGFLHWVDRSSLIVARVSVSDEQRARVIVDSYDDKDFSLTDATSFAVMERLGIVEAFTFDRHFRQFGFAVVGLDP
jgi:predicted nucleic acid-binding protein